MAAIDRRFKARRTYGVERSEISVLSTKNKKLCFLPPFSHYLHFYSMLRTGVFKRTLWAISRMLNSL